MSSYLGRIVAVGRTPGGRNVGVYRVSSRSFPNRRIGEVPGGLAVVPRAGFESDVLRNPYIAYHCVRLAGPWAVLTNGSQTDPIAERLATGAGPKDALVWAMAALDYEKDSLRTPRIAAVVPRDGGSAWLAVVRHDALVVKEVVLEPGRMTYLSTYEANDVRPEQTVAIRTERADELARAACEGPGFDQFTHPVAAAAVVAADEGFTSARYEVPTPDTAR